MNREPRSDSVRTMACLAYLPPIAVGLLIAPDYRNARFVRRHAVASLLLSAAGLSGAVLLSWIALLLGKLPWVGFWLLSASGLVISLWLMAAVGLAVAGALAAYQGKAARLAGLEGALRALERGIESPPRRGPRRGPEEPGS